MVRLTIALVVALTNVLTSGAALLTSKAAVQAAPPASSTLIFGKLFTSHMVFKADQPTPVWGFLPPASVVAVVFDGTILEPTTADANGLWLITLPALPASARPFTMSATSGALSQNLTDVLFGVVIGCHGQSNQDMPVSYAFNATSENATAADYPLIRYAYISPSLSNTPLSDFEGADFSGWQPANVAPYIMGWGAVCWFVGRDIADAFRAMGGDIPIGLFHAALGATPIQAWTPLAGASACVVPPNKQPESTLFNAMVSPLAVGPFAYTAVQWYQGEQNIGQDLYYTCALPAFVTSWRETLRQPNLTFVVAQLHAFTEGFEAGPAIPLMRAAQLSLDLPYTGVVPNLDGGDPQASAGNIHPRGKQQPARRLANAILDLALAIPRAWRAPRYASAAVVGGAALAPNTVSIDVTLDDASGGLTWVDPQFAGILTNSSRCPIDLGIKEESCAWFSLLLCVPNSALDGTWVNATASLPGGAILRLTAPVPVGATSVTACGTSNGGNSWPVVNVYAADSGLPLFPWNHTI